MQIIDGKLYYAMAIKQIISKTNINKPIRGNIYDSNEILLAVDIPAKTIYAVPKEIKDKEKAAKIIAKHLNLSKKTVLKIFGKNKNYVYIARKIEKDIALKLKQELKKEKIKGIYYTNVNKRYYPHKTLASKILGFVNIDGEGAAGIEYSLNTELKGKKGQIITEKNIFNNTKLKIKESKNGNNIYLTIDSILQSLAEGKLKKVVEETNAISGTFILMNPNTGEILVMADYPNFDNNNYKEYSSFTWLNNAVNLVYEPGSVFKLLTATIALNENLVSLDEKFIDNGYIKIENGKDRYGKPKYKRIYSWRRTGFGEITLAEAIAVSSNVALIEVGNRIPIDTYMEYLKKFGIGQKTGIKLPAESAGIIQSEKEIQKNIVRANMYIGQGIAVTPLQAIKAVSEIINGGYKIKPYIVKKITNENNKLLSIKEGKKGERIISEKTSQILKDMMYKEVEEGTGKKAKIKGYHIGGKTGTAQVAKNGRYLKDKYIVSFIGAVPIENPQLIGLVIINQPNVEKASGGKIAAPVFKEIMEEVLKYKNIPPIIENPDSDLIE